MSGAAVAGAVGAGTATADHFHPDVETDPASDIGSFSATLDGTLVDMGNADTVDVWFEWGESTNFGNTTPRQTLSSPEKFGEAIVVDEADQRCYFRAVSDTGSVIATGEVMEFITDSEFDLP